MSAKLREIAGAMQACVETMNDAAELFGAIQATKGQLTAEQIRAIASLGQCRLQDMANVLDCDREALEGMIAELGEVTA